MIHHRNPASPSSELQPFLLLSLMLSFSRRYSAIRMPEATLTLPIPACKRSTRCSTPSCLRARRDRRVEFFLNSRGYSIEHSSDKGSLVAMVRHVDTDTLQPATARVTFHFDPNEKLLSYELQSAPDGPAAALMQLDTFRHIPARNPLTCRDSMLV